MRIPIPTRIDLKLGAIFIVALFLIELAEGTELIFASLVAIWMALYFTAFTACKGLTYPSGAWIVFFGMASAFIGLIGKAALFEPAQTHLLEPNKTMAIYCVGMAVAGIAAYFAHRVAPKKGLLEGLLEGEMLNRASIGCLIMGAVLDFGVATFARPAPGSILAIIQQVNQFGRVALILATYYIVQKTDGRKSVSWVVLLAGGTQFYLGIIGYSKEGFFFPLVAWFLAAVVAGAHFSVKRLAALALVGFFMVHYLVPFSQYGRRSRSEEGGFADKTATAFAYLADLEGTRKLYLAAQDTTYVLDSDSPNYYDHEQTLLGREEMLAFDDRLIAYTDQGNVYGLSPEIIAVAALVPHFIWPNKPTFYSGNYYGRELGILSADDETTGISFSPVGDAYHQGEWFAVIFVLPLVVFIYGFNADAIAGGVRRSPWALLLIAVSASVAPEGLLGGTIYMSTFTMFAIVFIALLARYAFPFLVNVFLAQQQRLVAPRSRLNFSPSGRRKSLLDVEADPDVL